MCLVVNFSRLQGFINQDFINKYGENGNEELNICALAHVLGLNVDEKEELV